MSNEIEQRFLLREIENLKQRLERLEVQEQGRFIDIPTTTTDTGIIVADGTDGKKIKSTPAKVDASGNMELPSAASLKLKSYNVGEWQSWTPTLTGWTGTPTVVARYSVVGKICFWMLYINGTSNSSIATVTLPFTAANITNAYWGGANNAAQNGSSGITGASRWTITYNTNIVTFYTDMWLGAWSTSGTKLIFTNGWFEMA